MTSTGSRHAPAITLAPAVGAFRFGVGYSALRLRTGSVQPLMVLPFLTDLLRARPADQVATAAIEPAYADA